MKVIKHDINVRVIKPIPSVRTASETWPPVRRSRHFCFAHRPTASIYEKCGIFYISQNLMSTSLFYLQLIAAKLIKLDTDLCCDTEPFQLKRNNLERMVNNISSYNFLILMFINLC